MQAVAKCVEVSLVLSLANGEIKLESFEVLELEEYKIVSFTGLSEAFDWIATNVLNTILNALEDKLIKQLKGGIRMSLQVINRQYVVKLFSRLPFSYLALLILSFYLRANGISFVKALCLLFAVLCIFVVTFNVHLFDDGPVFFGVFK